MYECTFLLGALFAPQKVVTEFAHSERDPQSGVVDLQVICAEDGHGRLCGGGISNVYTLELVRIRLNLGTHDNARYSSIFSEEVMAL